MTTNAGETGQTQESESQELDLDIFESFFKSPSDVDETEEKEESTESSEEEGNDSEGSNETPTAAEIKTYTEEELEALIAGRFSELTQKAKTELSRREALKKQQEVDELIRTGAPEDAIKFIRDQISERELRERVATEEVGNYVSMVLPAIFTPEFVDSLTEEEAEIINPAKFDDDAEYLKAAIQLREQKAKSGLFGEDEVKRRVKEELEAQENERRGNRVRQPSGTSTPRTQEGEGLEGMTSARAKDAQWAMIVEGWQNGQDNE